jgi:hypothetical protein
MIELINEGLCALAALLGAIFITLGYRLTDSIATIIAVNTIGILRDNLGFVRGRSPDATYIEKTFRLPVLQMLCFRSWD